MARQPNWGTPGRTEQYETPGSTSRVLKRSLAVGVAIAAGLLLLAVAGYDDPLKPGAVISAHATIESQCQQCHSDGAGVLDLRCQRCHDAGGRDRTTEAHAFFARVPPTGNEDVEAKACARCHLEHRGRNASLAAIEELQCATCHFRSHSLHPEFAVFREPAHEDTGLKAFSHEGHFEALRKARPDGAEPSCLECHDYDGRDFAALSFDQSCASCHLLGGRQDELLVDLEDVLAPEALVALGIAGSWRPNGDEFEIDEGVLTKTSVRHRDEWVLFNIRKLQAELSPARYADERERVLTELRVLERRWYSAVPLAGVDEKGLQARQARIVAELDALAARANAQMSAVGPSDSVSSLQEVVARIAALGGALGSDAGELQRELAAYQPEADSTGPIPRDDFERRRAELRKILLFLEGSSSGDVETQRKIALLRDRIATLSAGFTSPELLGRAREQRMGTLERIKDELSLREAGTPPAPNVVLLGEQRRFQRMAEAKLIELATIPQWTVPSELPAAERARKEQALADLTEPCTGCHMPFTDPAYDVSAARRKLIRSTFVHEPHLLQTDGDCLQCHASVVNSIEPQQINFEGLESCNACHSSSEVSNDCLTCHFYHPPSP